MPVSMGVAVRVHVRIGDIGHTITVRQLNSQARHAGEVSWLREFWEHFWGRNNDEPSPERTVEAAWVPMWQSQMITDELISDGIPAKVVEDYGINMLVHSREPMARIFVTEDRKAEAEALIEEILGHPPRHRSV